ncbi:hypothetical protein EU805_01225 [Salipiger sp. IMCC34102]|uniref:hypothetical protein n=1 Tax=Salipiger sp. IMCC34102 TaxID=2510647 RepID=UPI00101BF913|nr:hypothetical protein [Salipiger sp. IMCC34102]RYH04022.1 hypothetical protein EU805_01225 [Salipiger sp. IMCC34102]
MTKFSLPLATCATALLTGAPALADVTASEVWDSWQQMMATGGTVTLETQSESIETDRVLIEGATYTYPVEDGETVVTIDRIELTDAGDGTVELVLPETIPVKLEDDEGNLIELSVIQTGLRTLVSGTPEAMNYAVTADRYAVETTRVMDPEGQPVDVSARVALNGVSGGYDQAASGLTEFDYDVRSDSVDLLLDMTDPDTGEEVTISGKVDGLGFEATASVPEEVDTADMLAMVSAGFALNMGYSYDSAAYIFNMGGTGTTGDGTATTGSGSLTFDMSEAGFSYDTDLNDVMVEVRGTELPFPIRVGAASYGTGVTLPVVPTEAPVPFGIRARLQQLTLGDEIWAMIDPQNMIPRDPASLNVDVSGEARLEQSLFADTEEMEDSPLGELVSVSVNDVSLALAGAMLEAVGAFTFDPEGPLATPDIGSPVGKATIDLTGGNQLIDTAIAMGLLPADQAMMARMMVGMFAEPVGEDALRSVIEVTPDGRVTANGQQIR